MEQTSKKIHWFKRMLLLCYLSLILTTMLVGFPFIFAYSMIIKEDWLHIMSLYATKMMDLIVKDTIFDK